MLGRDAREHVRAPDRHGELGVGETGELGARQSSVALVEQAELVRDRLGRDAMVSRDHLDGNPGAVAGGDGCDRLRSGRIDHALEAEQRETAVDIAVVERRARLRAPRDGEHPHPLGGHPLDLGVDRVSIDVVAAGEDHLRGSLEQDLAGVQRRHELPLRLERSCVEAWVPLALELGIDACLPRGDDERPLGRVAVDAPGAVLERDGGVTAEDGAPEELLHVGPHLGDGAGVAEKLPVGGVADPREAIDPTAGRPELLDGHLVARQGSRLVGTDDGRRPERLDRGQPADHGTPPRHPLDADRERDRDDRRQPLRDRADGKRDAGQHRVDERVAAREADADQQRGDDGDCDGEPGRDPCHRPRQRRLELGGAFEERRDVAELGVAAGCDDGRGARPVRDQRAAVGHAAPVGDRAFRLDGRGALRHRHRLAGQGRLLDLEVSNVEEAEVGGHLVARCELDDVAGDEFGHGHRQTRPVTDNRGEIGHHLDQRLDRLPGPELLQEADHGVRDHDAEDDGAVDRLPERDCERPGTDQHPDQRVVDLADEHPQGAIRAGPRDHVRAVRGQAARSVVRAKPAPVARESLQNIHGLSSVPGNGDPGRPLDHRRHRTSKRSSSRELGPMRSSSSSRQGDSNPSLVSGYHDPSRSTSFSSSPRSSQIERQWGQ